MVFGPHDSQARLPPGAGRQPKYLEATQVDWRHLHKHFCGKELFPLWHQLDAADTSVVSRDEVGTFDPPTE